MVDKKTKPLITFKLYRDSKSEWRWSAHHRNGNIVADSGEGYERRGACLRTLRNIMRSIQDGKTTITA